MTAPSGKIEPIHDIWTSVTGPDSNGQSADCNSGNAGFTHPKELPNPNVRIFARISISLFQVNSQILYVVVARSTFSNFT